MYMLKGVDGQDCPLCLSCFTSWQQAQAALQQAQNERVAQLMARENYLIEMMGAITGVPVSFPRIRIPQPYVNRGLTLNQINIDRSVIGMLNTGSIQNVKQIDVNVRTMTDAGRVEMANALRALTEAVASNREVSDQQRTEMLDQLNLVSNEAVAPDETRKAGIIKPVVTALAGSLSAAGSLAKLWSMFGDAICRHFGFENPFKNSSD